MSEPNHGTKRQAPAGSSNHSNTNEDHSADDLSSLPGTATYVIEDDGSFTQKSRAQRKRKRFDAKRRSEVAEVRKRGACEQCRVRKVRCTHVLDSPPAPKNSPQSFLSNFGPEYSMNMNPETRQWPLPDDTHHFDSSSAEFDDLIGQYPTERRDKIAQNLSDIDTVLEDGSRSRAVKSFAATPTWGDDLPWALAVTNDQPYSHPSTYSTRNHSVDMNSLPFNPASTNAGPLPPNVDNEDHSPLGLREWSRAKFNRGGNPRRDHVHGNPRVHREPIRHVRRFSSQLQRHFSPRAVDGTLQRSPDLFNVTGSSHEFTSAANDFGASFQQPDPRPGPIMDGMSSLALQTAMPQRQPQFRSSPNLSLIDQFEHNLEISSQPYTYPASDGIPEDVLLSDMVQSTEKFLTTPLINTQPTFEGNWDTESQLLDTFDSQPFNFYDNTASSPIDYNAQSVSAYSDVPMQTWTGQASSNFGTQNETFDNVYGLSGFQSEVQFQQSQFSTNNDLSVNFPAPSGAAKTPSIIITALEDDQIILNTNHNTDFVQVYNTKPIPSQRNAYQPSLDLSTLSSSGASETRVSPVDAPGLMNDRYADENCDMQSVSPTLWFELGNMNMVG